MLPSIGILFSVEMIRDGGSLAATFQGSDGCKYWLFLQVRLNKLPSGELERVAYEEPVVIDRLAEKGIPVTWPQARVLLAQIRPLLHKERDQKWFEIMQEVVLTEGALPRGVNRHFERSKTQKQNEQA
jgi:hypothetical protein